MNRLRNIVLFIVSSFLFGAIPDWVDDPGSYQFQATISSGIILHNGNQIGDEGDILAAFDSNGNVRGVGTQLVDVPGAYAGSPVFEIQVRSNVDDEILSFKFYDASEDIVYPLVEDYTFIINDIVGGIDNPEVFNTKFINLSFDNITSTSFDIRYESTIDLAGFQFNIDGIDIESIFGGVISDLGYTTTFNNGLILAFSLLGQSIPAGSGVLMSINYTQIANELIVLDDVVLAGLDDVGADSGSILNNAPITFTGPNPFNYNQSTLQAFYYFSSITLNGQELDSLDWVGAFKDGLCVGARQWNIEECGEGICDVPAMGNDGQNETAGYMNFGDEPSFKIYDQSENMVYNAIPSENIQWAPNGTFSIDQLSYLAGCSDSNACNYDENVTDDDSSCEYAQQNYDCSGNCISTIDCNGDCAGTALEDACGVCSGGNSDHVADSDIDECGDCFGDGIAEGACDCEGNIEDECGVCAGNSSTCLDCNGVPNGAAVEDECGVCGGNGIADGACDCDGNIDLDCGCGEPGPSGCDNVCGSTSTIDDCGVCGGDSSSCADCAGVPYGNSTIDECGTCDDNPDNDCICSSEIYDDCGVCDGDNSSCSDCAGIPNGDSEDLGCGCGEPGPTGCDSTCGSTLEIDDCGICGGDNSTCAVCLSGIYDNCGICDGDNSDCWYIDIFANINDEVNDFNSRIGMHVAASDGYNDDDIEGINCLDCYKDKIDVPMGQPDDNFDLYFPHPEWEDDIPELHQTTNLEDDIRHYAEFSFSDFDVSTVIISDQTVYYPQQVWDLEISSDVQNIEVGPDGAGGGVWAANTVTMQFDFTNQFPQSDFTKAFVYLETDEGFIIEEITNGDTFSIEDYISPKSVKIIIGWDSSTMPQINEIISPISNQILPLDDSPLLIELDLQQDYLIASLDVFFEIDNTLSEVITFTDIDDFLIIDSNDYYDFLNDNVMGDFNDNITIHIELTDVGGVGASTYPGEGYRRSSNDLLFSRNTSTTSFSTGWNLISPSLEAVHNLESLFSQPAYTCSSDCGEILTANSGQGFYVRSFGESLDYTFIGDVLPDYSLYIDQGWNLIGNPLVRDIDLSEIRVNYGGYEYNWFDAAEFGIVVPNPIIYDNSKASHVGIKRSDIIGKAQGFWVNSNYDNVEIFFDPINGFSQDVVSKYWDISIYSKENPGTSGNIADFDEATGSEVVIGINELADDELVYGQDQNQLLINNMSIFNSKYSLLEIDNDGNSSVYKDIRSYHDTLLEWDISLVSEKFSNTEGIKLDWDIREYNQLYDNAYKFYLNTIPDSICQTALDVYNKDYCYNMEETDDVIMLNDGDVRITAVLEDQFIGCTYEEDGESYDLGISCGDLDCLGGNQNLYCDFSGLSFVDENDPDAFLNYYETSDLDFNLSIALNNAQGLDIEGLSFTLEYDVDAINFAENALIPSDIIESNYSYMINTSIPGKFIVYAYTEGSVINIPDNETLFTLSGEGRELGQTEIYFSSILINEQEASFGENLTILFRSLFYSVQGSVKYYSSNKAVPNVNIIADLHQDDIGPSFTPQTDSYGNFFEDEVEVELDDIDYEMQLSKAPEIDIENSYYDGLSAVDASRIARYALNNYEFNSEQLLAANVSLEYRCKKSDGGYDPLITNKQDCEDNDGFEFVPYVSSYDAVLVAKYAAGIHSFLNQDTDNNTEICNPNWIFIDSLQATQVIDNNNGMCDNVYNQGAFNNTYDLSLNSDTSLVFSGIRLGDVTGNWNAADLSRESRNGRSDSPIVDVELNDIINLPIYLPNEREIEGVDIIVQFDPEVFKLLGFSDRNTILDESIYKTIINTDIEGEFRLVSFANLDPIENNGLIGSLKFEVVGISSSISEIIIDELDINEISEGGFLIQDGENFGGVALSYQFNLVSIPSEFALNQNFPNPFNPSTNIQFDLPESGEVKIAIFDVKGSLVEELSNGYLDAGYHKLTWNASNQASGMYFLQMVADNGQYIKITKMMLMK